MISKHSLSKCLKKVQCEKHLKLSSELNKVYFPLILNSKYILDF